MASTANEGQPGSEQQLDLTNHAPASVAYQLPLDRITVAVNGGRFGGRTDIEVKGSLRPVAEHALLCAIGAAIALATVTVCRIGGLSGLGVTVSAIGLGAASYATGLWHLTRRRTRI